STAGEDQGKADQRAANESTLTVSGKDRLADALGLLSHAKALVGRVIADESCADVMDPVRDLFAVADFAIQNQIALTAARQSNSELCFHRDLARRDDPQSLHTQIAQSLNHRRWRASWGNELDRKLRSNPDARARALFATAPR